MVSVVPSVTPTTFQDVPPQIDANLSKRGLSINVAAFVIFAFIAFILGCIAMQYLKLRLKWKGCVFTYKPQSYDASKVTKVVVSEETAHPFPTRMHRTVSSSGRACNLGCCLCYCDLSIGDYDQKFMMDDAKYTTQIKDDDTCVICLDKLASHKVVKLGCDHKFHKKCIVRWITRKPSCPLCKKVALKTSLKNGDRGSKVITSAVRANTPIYLV